ncbi:MAG: glycosyltransferase, partial [Proteobacteria bacterium]|nr:glycosyltransferase [Pseudomonadota bacterium]
MNATQPLAGFKILVVMPSIPLYGLELANIEIMRLLQDKGADILFAVNRDHGQRVIKALDRAGLVYAKVGFAAPWSLPRSWQAWRTLRKNLQEISHDMQVVVRKFGPDCIFMTGLSYLLYSIPWLMRIRCRVIFNVPNPPDLAARPRRKRWLQNLLWRRAAAPFTRVFVANSDFTRNAIAAVGIRAGKIQRIYLSVPQRN